MHRGHGQGQCDLNRFSYRSWKKNTQGFGRDRDEHTWGGGLVAKLCPTLATPEEPTRLLCPWDFPGRNAGMGSHSLLQGIFPTQGSKLHLLNCRQILCHWTTREAPTCGKLHEICSCSGGLEFMSSEPCVQVYPQQSTDASFPETAHSCAEV